MRVLVTGCCGFIGHAVTVRLLEDGHTVIGVDKLSQAKSNKTERVVDLCRRQDRGSGRFRLLDINLSDWEKVEDLLDFTTPEVVCHFAAQTSVVHSPDAVQSYIEGNLVGAVNLFEAAYEYDVRKIIYASSTYVVPSRLPPTMYAATKEFGERVLNTYANLGVTVLCLRFPTTYGPLGRMDSPVGNLLTKVWQCQPINLSGFNSRVSYLYIRDGAEVVSRAVVADQENKYEVRTVVGHLPRASLMDIIEYLEKGLQRKAKTIGEPGPYIEPTVPKAEADNLQELIGYSPSTPLAVGIAEFVEWWKQHHK